MKYKYKLNKPYRLPAGSTKKFAVYTRNPKTNKIIKVRFGDPNMRIKRSSDARRKSFRARHKCATANDKTTARYWSCQMWRKNKTVGAMLR